MKNWKLLQGSKASIRQHAPWLSFFLQVEKLKDLRACKNLSCQDSSGCV
jgi:hypothetical protein